ncbi:hypothetical protein LCGC14_2707170 [marine sediment metagenome]|uniref:Uncharacterized protein n=1 Tax=marine sediment metagenome TaxID=412755 RepID=A0A0F9C5U3_9ZZZZ
MNQKDYKEIAEIIKKNKFDLISGSYSDMDIAMIKDLADYFEREDKCLTCNGKGGHYYQRTPDTNEDAEMCNDCDGKGIKEFNRQQFLKDCGVEK